MFKRFATLTAGLAIAFAALGSPAHAASHHRGPDAGERSELRTAQKATGRDYTCHLEWDGPAYNGYEAICAKKPRHIGYSKIVLGTQHCTVKAVARRDHEACVSLYMRPSHWSKDRSTYTPYGFALVFECLSQYRGVELHDCLRQPAES